MKHKITNLAGASLDAAVALAEGWNVAAVDEAIGGALCYALAHPARAAKAIYALAKVPHGMLEGYHPSWQWPDGGPIVERECIELVVQTGSDEQHRWAARHYPLGGLCTVADGPTPLIAAMRAYARSKFGDEVELP